MDEIRFVAQAVVSPLVLDVSRSILQKCSFFSSQRDDSGKITVGSDNDHFHVCMSSVRLLNNNIVGIMNNQAMQNIDGTYCIFTEKFTLVAFGLSDKARHYHPVAFMVTSHETSSDYELLLPFSINGMY